MKISVTGGSGFIGTNLIDYLISRNITILNLDIAIPKKRSHVAFWQRCDILEPVLLRKLFTRFQPTHVVHLAARADVDGSVLEDYKANTDGTKNVLEAIKATASVQRAIITSTQFVHQYHGLPQHDEDYAPHTVYGESKVITEKLTRQIALDCIWTIIRPTNIWGPWHPRYPYEFWKTIGKGHYVHPGKQVVARSYGYVGNVVYQVMKIFELPAEVVNRHVFYVGDPPINLYEWVNGFSMKQRGKKVIVVPRIFVRILAWVGDILKMFGLEFPITSSRYKSMTTSNDAPMTKTLGILGMPPFSLDRGIDETIQWLKDAHPELVKI